MHGTLSLSLSLSLCSRSPLAVIRPPSTAARRPLCAVPRSPSTHPPFPCPSSLPLRPDSNTSALTRSSATSSRTRSAFSAPRSRAASSALSSLLASASRRPARCVGVTALYCRAFVLALSAFWGRGSAVRGCGLETVSTPCAKAEGTQANFWRRPRLDQPNLSAACRAPLPVHLTSSQSVTKPRCPRKLICHRFRPLNNPPLRRASSSTLTTSAPSPATSPSAAVS